MLHDVIAEIYDPGRGAFRETIRVDAAGGDDAASQASVEAARIAVGRTFRILGVAPAVIEDEPPTPAQKGRKKAAANAIPEGDDFPDDPGA